MLNFFIILYIYSKNEWSYPFEWLMGWFKTFGVASAPKHSKRVDSGALWNYREIGWTKMPTFFMVVHEPPKLQEKSVQIHDNSQSIILQSIQSREKISFPFIEMSCRQFHFTFIRIFSLTTDKFLWDFSNARFSNQFQYEQSKKEG